MSILVQGITASGAGEMQGHGCSRDDVSAVLCSVILSTDLSLNIFSSICFKTMKRKWMRSEGQQAYCWNVYAPATLTCVAQWQRTLCSAAGGP